MQCIFTVADLIFVLFNMDAIEHEYVITLHLHWAYNLNTSFRFINSHFTYSFYLCSQKQNPANELFSAFGGNNALLLS